jgi:plasmid stability protein
MAQLIVRNISRMVVDALKRRAAKHGRSTEAEHRVLLEETLLKNRGRSFKEHLLAIPSDGEDADFETSRDVASRVDL